MSPLPGEKYVASNKFNTLYWSVALLIAFFVAVGIGRLYALISLVNPIIYLNFLVLAGAVILLGVVASLVKLISKSRNKTLNLLTSVFICIVAWLAHWAHIANGESHRGFWVSLANFPHLLGFAADFAESRNMGIGRLGRNTTSISPAILFLGYCVEAVAFFAPVYFIFKTKDYYCEDCNNEYSTLTAYIDNNDKLYQHASDLDRGDLRFLKNVIFHRSIDTLDLDAREKPGIGSIELNYCNKCNQNAIVNIKSGVLKQDEKARRSMGSEDTLLEDTYITTDSKLILQANLLLENSPAGLVRIG